MKASPKSLMLAGLVLFAPFLVAAMAFGYSGSAEAAAVGNVVFLVGFALGGLVFLGGVLAWIVKVGVRAASE